MRLCNSFFWVLLIVATGLGFPLAKSAEAKDKRFSIASSVGQIARITNRIFLSELLGVPSDTRQWRQADVFRGASLALAEQPVRCWEHEKFLSQLVPSGERFGLSGELAKARTKFGSPVWPLRCTPVDVLDLKSLNERRLVLRMLNLLDPHLVANELLKVGKDLGQIRHFMINDANLQAQMDYFGEPSAIIQGTVPLLPPWGASIDIELPLKFYPDNFSHMVVIRLNIDLDKPYEVRVDGKIVDLTFATKAYSVRL